MRAVLVGVATAVLMPALGGVAGGRQDATKIDAKLLVGRWQPKQEGEGFYVEFTQDGKMLFNAKIDRKELKVEGTYKLDGYKLSFKASYGGMDRDETRTVYTLSKTELVIADLMGQKGQKLTLLRIPAKSDHKE